MTCFLLIFILICHEHLFSLLPMEEVFSPFQRWLLHFDHHLLHVCDKYSFTSISLTWSFIQPTSQIYSSSLILKYFPLNISLLKLLLFIPSSITTTVFVKEAYIYFCFLFTTSINPFYRLIGSQYHRNCSNKIYQLCFCVFYFLCKFAIFV